MKILRGLLTISLLLSVLSFSVRAETGRGRHKRAFAVPAPEDVKIDGRLDDWDMSGHILAYVRKAASEVQSARFAVMYDEEAIYLGADVKDPNPMRFMIKITMKITRKG